MLWSVFSSDNVSLSELFCIKFCSQSDFIIRSYFYFFPQKSELTEFIIILIVWMHVHIVRVKLLFVSLEFQYQM